MSNEQDRDEAPGAVLRRMRGERGMSLSALAKQAHFSKGYLSRIETGERPMSLDVARACDAVLGGEGGLAALVSEGAADACPYPGLAAFQAGQARWFFGRERASARLVACVGERMDGGGPLAVVAPSGTGKSSLLRAGLVPALARGCLPGSAGWRVEVCTPTARPKQVLARLDAVADDSRRALIVVDQFEELFTECQDEDERRAFVAALCTWSGPGPRTVPVVIGVRADLYGRCLAYPELLAALENGHLPLGPMNRAELVRAVEGPAAAEGLELEVGLVDLLLSDLGADPVEAGTLPLLAHALLATWQQREGRVLTVAGYRRTGGVREALATTAEAVYLRQPQDGRAAVHRMMIRLVHAGDGVRQARRRVPLERLLWHEPAERRDHARAAVEALGRARMLTLTGDGVEITHEALLTAWPRLREWLDADRAGLRVHRQLGQACEAWQDAGRDPSALYQGTRLALAREWARGDGAGALSPPELAFLTRSQEAEEAAQRAALARARRLRRLTAALAGCLALALSAGAVAWGQRGRAVTAARLARSDEYAAQAQAVAATEPDVAMLLAAEAFRAADTPRSRSALLSAQGQSLVGQFGDAGGRAVNAAAVSADGRTAATSGNDGVLRLWDLRPDGSASRARFALSVGLLSLRAVTLSHDAMLVATAGADGITRVYDTGTPAPAVRQYAAHGGPVRALAYAPAGRLLAEGGDDGTVRLYDDAAPARPPVVIGEPGHGGVLDLAFSPDGRTLAVARADGAVLPWDVAKGTAGEPWQLGPDLRALAFSPDASLLAVAQPDGVRIWHTDTRAPAAAPLTGHTDAVLAVAFAPDGRTLATGGRDNAVRVWDIATGQPVATLSGHSGPVNAVRFVSDTLLLTVGDDAVNRLWRLGDPVLVAHPAAAVLSLDGVSGPTGPQVVAGAVDGTLHLWDVARHTEVTSRQAHTGAVWGIVHSPDGTLLATAGADHVVRLWHTADLSPAGELTGHTGPVKALAFSADGRRLASAGNDGVVRLWDVATSAPAGELTGHDDEVLGLAFIGDGTLLASAGQDETVRLWDTRTGRATVLHDHHDTVFGVAASPDGTLLATAGRDGEVHLRPVADPQRVTVLPGHTGPIVNVRFSPDGTRLVSGSRDRTARVWRVPGGTLEAELRGHAAAVQDGVFTDARTLVTASRDGTLRRWDLDPGRVLARVCGLAPRPDPARWQRLVPQEPVPAACH
ncbi:helix-turn-helix domain-containing protein [Kitasatospora sp. NPDC057904]|uniref:nSTAND1 domain-containing NTPase n=1 Tax=Kitasatospora sp. NPDC057904 TaxID=3346275 RepID=UPI0036DDD3CB